MATLNCWAKICCWAPYHSLYFVFVPSMYLNNTTLPQIFCMPMVY